MRVISYSPLHGRVHVVGSFNVALLVLSGFSRTHIDLPLTATRCH